MKNYNKNIESSYVEYLDANNLYGWAISQKLPVEGFKWVKQKNYQNLTKISLKKYDEDCNRGYLKKFEKVEKLICSIEDKEKYVIHIRALKQALNHGLKLKKVHR